MPKFAQLTTADADGIRTAFDVIEGDAIEKLVHPSLAGRYRSVPNSVVVGSRLNRSTWSHPDPVDEAPETVMAEPRRLKLSPPEYLLQFTPQERVAIRAKAASTEADDAAVAPILADWLTILADPRLTVVDVGLPQTQAGHDFLISVGLLDPERKAEIETGLAA